MVGWTDFSEGLQDGQIVVGRYTETEREIDTERERGIGNQ